MNHQARKAVCALAVLAILPAAGCGGDGDGGTAAPTARFTFTADGLRPATRTVRAAPEIRLTIVAADGRPHGVVVRTPSGRVRLVVLPDAAQSATLRGLRAGGRYRVVPDGAADPVVLQVR